MNENKEAGKKTICLCKKTEISPAFLLAIWNERKPSVNLYGWNEIKITVIQSGKQTFCKENKMSLQKDNKKQGKRKRSHSGFRAFNMERKKTIRQSVRME